MSQSLDNFLRRIIVLDLCYTVRYSFIKIFTYRNYVPDRIKIDIDDVTDLITNSLTHSILRSLITELKTASMVLLNMVDRIVLD